MGRGFAGRPAAVLVSSTVASVLGIGPVAAGAPNPECAWSDRFGASDLWRLAEATAVFDGGTGEALYVGGTMVTAGGQDVGLIARWDGSSWSPLTGPFGTGVDDTVADLEVFDDGSGPALYVAGGFRQAGGLPAEFIARWDGSQWSALPEPSTPGFQTPVTELEVFDDGSGPVLVAAGITYDPDTDRRHLAAWDGSAWTGLGSGLGGSDLPSVLAMAVWDDGSGPALYVGGFFETAGGVAAANLARWDGTAWSAVHGSGGVGPDEAVFALEVFDDGSGPALYAGGWFEHVDGVAAQGVARWDGTAWSAVVPPSSGGRRLVYALTVHDDGSGPALWIGGDFRQLGGVLADGVARWDGQAFSEPAAGGIEGTVRAMISWNDGTGTALYVGGTMTEAGETPVGHIARLAGGGWSRLGAGVGHGMNYHVREFAVYDDGTGPAVYAAGDFTLGGDSETFHIARWTGGGWAPLVGDTGPRFDVDGEVGALAVYDDGNGPALYVGGWFVTLDGEPVGSLARWDGVAWSAVDPANPLLRFFRQDAVAGKIYSLGVFDDGTGEALYVGGFFSHVGDLEVNHVARWDGTSWSGLGVGVLATGGIHDFEVWDDGTGPALYVGGGFLEAGGIETRLSVARWDGSGWSVLVDAGGLDARGTVSALEVFDDGTGPALYAGGTLNTQFPFDRGIFRWDGSCWHGLGTSDLGGVVWDLEVFDDGAGPALYAGGRFDEIDLLDPIEVRHVARWDGNAWTPLSGPGGPGTFPSDGVFTLAADPNTRALWIGGDFALAGGVPSNYVARWTCGAEEPDLRALFVGFF